MSDTIISRGNVDKRNAKETHWLELIDIGKLSAEEQRDLWNNRSFYRNNSAEANRLIKAAQISTHHNSKEMKDMRVHYDRTMSGLRAQSAMLPMEDRAKHADGLLRKAKKE
jgi:hypothetical protein